MPLLALLLALALPQALALTCGDGTYYYLQITQTSTVEACYPCPSNTAGTGGFCFTCSTNIYSTVTGKTACASCAAGTYMTSAGTSVCSACTSGGQGSAYSTPPPGTWGACAFTCNAGYFQPTPAAACQPCSTGRYSTARGITSDAQCATCAPGSYVPYGVGASACTACEAGKFSTNSGSAVCATCQSPKGCQQGCFSRACSATRNLECTSCLSQSHQECAPSLGACPAGQIPLENCTDSATRTTDTTCVACPEGKYQPASASTCSFCGPGNYTSSGTGCAPCNSLAPRTNYYYLPWEDGMPVSSDCWWGCNAGYYKYRTPSSTYRECRACPAWQFSARGVQTACADCPHLAYPNAYTVATAAPGDCVWDCNAGFYRAAANATACSLCPDGAYCTQRRTASAQAPNAPRACTPCVYGQQYEAAPCLPTQDRQCALCRSCAPGQYQSAPCLPTQDRGCTACRTACNASYYLSAVAAKVCRGDASTADPVTCVPCASPDACTQVVSGAAGRYMPDTCTGNTTTDRVCAVCGNPVCTYDQYLTGCTGFQDRACAAIPLCPAGQYRAGATLTSPGACAPCTNCSSIAGAANVVRACTRYADTQCGGERCNASAPCAATSDTRRFCDYSGVEPNASSPRAASGYCGVCPEGYDSDGLRCLACPPGATCDDMGRLACRGQCAPGEAPWCDPATGFARCRPCAPGNYTAAPDRYVVSRASHVQAATCAPAYFGCARGYSLRFFATGALDCLPCTSMPVGAAYATQGLSPGDDTSCLWECLPGYAYSGGACASRNRPDAAANLPGYYGSARAAQACPQGKTSVENDALVAQDCLDCPPLPEAASRVASAACQYRCTATGYSQRGSLCVRPPVCPSAAQGVSTDPGTQACGPTPWPWQSWGYRRTGVYAYRAATSVFVLDAGFDLLYFSPAREFRFHSAQEGVYRRHSVTVSLLNGVYPTDLQLPGRACSAAHAGGWLFLAFCNQSFVAYADLDNPTRAPRVLIGLNQPGYQEGFRASAQFNSVLHLAMDPVDNSTVYVLDTLNHVLREIALPLADPTSPLVRSFLVHGTPNKPFLAASLRSPNWIRPMGPGMLVLLDSAGLWQLDAPSRTVTAVVRYADSPELAELGPDTLPFNVSGTSARVDLVYRGPLMRLMARTEPCPPGLSSNLGSDCQVPCPANSYVDLSNGGCRPCGTPACGRGEVLRACAAYAPAACVPCPALGPDPDGNPRVYTAAGSCEAVGYAPPCPRDYYATQGLCAPCPRLAYTELPGATTLEACRCPGGFPMDLALRQCLVGQLYPLPSASACPFGRYNKGGISACVSCREAPCPQCGPWQYPTSACNCSDCLLPAHARATAGGRLDAPTTCQWACDPGYFPVSALPFRERCQPCVGLPPGYVWLTGGDPDESASCQAGCAPGLTLGQGGACV